MEMLAFLSEWSLLIHIVVILAIAVAAKLVLRFATRKAVRTIIGGVSKWGKGIMCVQLCMCHNGFWHGYPWEMGAAAWRDHSPLVWMS